MIPASMPTPAGTQDRPAAADPTTRQSRRLAAALLTGSRKYSHGVDVAQSARSHIAHEIADAVVAGRIPDLVDVAAYRLLADVARRAERLLEARLRARHDAITSGLAS